MPFIAGTQPQKPLPAPIRPQSQGPQGQQQVPQAVRNAMQLAGQVFNPQGQPAGGAPAPTQQPPAYGAQPPPLNPAVQQALMPQRPPEQTIGPMSIGEYQPRSMGPMSIGGDQYGRQYQGGIGGMARYGQFNPMRRGMPGQGGGWAGMPTDGSVDAPMYSGSGDMSNDMGNAFGQPKNNEFGSMVDRIQSQTQNNDILAMDPYAGRGSRFRQPMPRGRY